MNKIAIITFNNLIYSPYANYYMQILDELKLPYDLILLNRGNMKESCNGTLINVHWNPLKRKIENLLRFSVIAGKRLKQNHYEKVVVLTTIPAVLLSVVLRKYYKKRYIVDIRDYTHENNFVYYFIEKKVLTSSYINVISSPKFTCFLPDGHFYICHNLNIPNNRIYHFSKNTDGPIRIAYVGTIGYQSQCMKLIRLVEHDQRFEFNFYGNMEGLGSVQAYFSGHTASNIHYYGPYFPGEKEKIITDNDILFNAYGNGSKLLDYALSNKFYDSLFYKKPLITSPKTYMSEISGLYSYDLDFAFIDNLNGLYDWYLHIPIDSFEQDTSKQLMQYKIGNEKLADVLRSFFKEKEICY